MPFIDKLKDAALEHADLKKREADQRALREQERVVVLSLDALTNAEQRLLEAAKNGATTLVVARLPHAALGRGRRDAFHTCSNRCGARSGPTSSPVSPNWLHLDERLTPDDFPEPHPSLVELWTTLIALGVRLKLSDTDPLSTAPHGPMFSVVADWSDNED
jgi:hypothetical protein